jgi:hypothetical protein
MSGSTGALRVWHGAETGAIWFDRGTIIHASAGPREGRNAVFEMVAWEDGKFTMDLNVTPPARTVQEGTTGLVLEALRRADERKIGRDPEAEAPAEEVTAHDGDFVDFFETLSKELGTDALGPGSQDLSDTPFTDQLEEETMPNNVNVALEKLRTIDGYIGACVVDSESAMSLGADGGGAMLNLDVAAAGNAEVVKAKRKAMRALGLKDEIEDILISLGKQYHLIRPLRQRPSVFIYVALERSRANLAMARMSVSDIEKQIEI